MLPVTIVTNKTLFTTLLEEQTFDSSAATTDNLWCEPGPDTPSHPQRIGVAEFQLGGHADLLREPVDPRFTHRPAGVDDD